MLTKSFAARVKAAGTDDGLEDGQFEALVSVFGNVDSYGDVVMPGAFAETLKQWEASGDPIPVYWSHRMDDPDMNIGHVLEAKETADGLWVKGQLDLDDAAPKAKQVYRLMKGRRVTQFSFAYDVLEAGWAKHEDQDRDVYELRKLKVYEVGPTPIGANQETELLAVKAAGERASRIVADLKAGRVLSAKNENALREGLASLETAAKQIKDVLSALDAGEADDDGKATAGTPAKDEDPKGKSEEPTSRSPADLSALQSIELAALAG